MNSYKGYDSQLTNKNSTIFILNFNNNFECWFQIDTLNDFNRNIKKLTAYSELTVGRCENQN